MARSRATSFRPCAEAVSSKLFPCCNKERETKGGKERKKKENGGKEKLNCEYILNEQKRMKQPEDFQLTRMLTEYESPGLSPLAPSHSNCHCGKVFELHANFSV